MNPQVPEYIQRLKPYVPGKPIEETQREFRIRKVAKLASNENALGPSPKALQAVRKVLKQNHLYPDASAFRLRKALAKFHRMKPEAFAVGNGSNEVIDLLIRTFCLPGDAMVTSQAAFVAYRICAQVHGVETFEAPLTSDFCFDLDAIAELVEQTPRAKMVFIANPNNPTGTFVAPDSVLNFLRRIQTIRGGSVLVVIDSAYQEYVTPKWNPSQWLSEFSNLVVLRTFSKIYGLAGFRLGYSISAPEIAAHLDRIRNPFNVNLSAQAAGEAALADLAFVRKSKTHNRSSMKLWKSYLEKNKIPYLPSEGNFYLVNAVQGWGRSVEEVNRHCLKQGVILRPVANYGLTDWIRISMGTSAENRLAMNVLSKIKRG